MRELSYRFLTQTSFQSLVFGTFKLTNTHNFSSLLIRGYLFTKNVVFLCSDQNVSLIVQGDYLDDNSQPLPQVPEKLQPSEDSKIEQSKQDTQFPQEGPQNPSVIDGTAYGLGIMPPVVGSHLVQPKGHEAQAHESRVANFAVSFRSPFLYTISPHPFLYLVRFIFFLHIRE